MRNRITFAVFVGSVLAGFLVDGMLRVTPWGLGFLVVAIGFAALGAVMLRLSRRRPAVSTLLIAIGGIGCASMLALRDSSTLSFFNAFICLSLFALLPLSVLASPLSKLGPMEWLFTTLVAVADTFVGGFLYLTSDVPWSEVRQEKFGRPALAVSRGVILTVPPLVIFGVLLSAADAVFAEFMRRLIDIELEELVLHFVLIVAGAWLANGWLTRAALRDPMPTVNLELPIVGRVGGTELLMLLGSVNILFAAFVAIQIRYFFGGAELIAMAPGLTRAEYAREGFFELVTVAALVVLALLFIDWIADKSKRKVAVFIRVLSFLQVGLVGVMLVSAWQRMRLYVEEFGLTELRFYTSAFMLWLGVVLAWFCVTVLVSNRSRFGTGVVAFGVVTLLGINAVNPDAIIVRTNVERAMKGRALDPAYLNRLSADAVPAIIDSLPLVSKVNREVLEDGLRARNLGDADWRSWCLARAEASERIAGVSGT